MTSGMTSGTWWCLIVVEMVFSVSSWVVVALKGRCVCAASLRYPVGTVGAPDPGRNMESQGSLSLLHQSWNWQSLLALFRELKLQETISGFSTACFWLVWLPALSLCAVVWAPMLAQAEGAGRLHGCSMRGQDFASLVLELIRPKTTKSITRSYYFKGKLLYTLSIASSQ